MSLTPLIKKLVKLGVEDPFSIGSGGSLPPGAYINKGSIDASTNPNYPAGDNGDTYKISVAGHIGGALGPVVAIGDTLICNVDGSLAGTHAAVGANWSIIQTNIDDTDLLKKSDNLSGLTNTTTARTNLGLLGFATKTDNYSVTMNDVFLYADVTNKNIVFSLPDATLCSGTEIGVKIIGTNTSNILTVTCFDSQILNDQGTVSTVFYWDESFTLKCNGVRWYTF